MFKNRFPEVGWLHACSQLLGEFGRSLSLPGPEKAKLHPWSSAAMACLLKRPNYHVGRVARPASIRIRVDQLPQAWCPNNPEGHGDRAPMRRRFAHSLKGHGTTIRPLVSARPEDECVHRYPCSKSRVFLLCLTNPRCIATVISGTYRLTERASSRETRQSGTPACFNRWTGWGRSRERSYGGFFICEIPPPRR